jgi:hypothetical protein
MFGASRGERVPCRRAVRRGPRQRPRVHPAAGPADGAVAVGATGGGGARPARPCSERAEAGRFRNPRRREDAGDRRVLGGNARGGASSRACGRRFGEHDDGFRERPGGGDPTARASTVHAAFLRRSPPVSRRTPAHANCGQELYQGGSRAGRPGGDLCGVGRADPRFHRGCRRAHRRHPETALAPARLRERIAAVPADHSVSGLSDRQQSEPGCAERRHSGSSA